MKTFRIGGVHPNPDKLTSNTAISNISEPEKLTLSLHQNIGSPSKVIVKKGEYVNQGQLIGEAQGTLSVNLHAPRAGIIKSISKLRNMQGFWDDVVELDVDSDAVETIFEERSSEEIDKLEPEQIVQIIRESGIVGMGGAAFPTAVKLMPPKDTKPDIFIINGAECEPYLTCDDRLMQENADGIIKGAELLMRAVGVKNCLIGIEHNKPAAISAMTDASRNYKDIKVIKLKTKYPQGGEKQLIQALTGREVPSGKLPVTVGAIVDNVATAFAVYEAVYLGKPLMERVITVTGNNLSSPGNFKVPIGTSVRHLLDCVGGLAVGEDYDIISGGPMMGKSISNIDAPILKATSGILVLNNRKYRKEEPCISCSKCLQVCPMGLEPYLMIKLARKRMWETMRDRDVMDCIECGSCNWICPASKPLLEHIRLGKLELRKHE